MRSEELRSEIEIMKLIGHHPSIIALFGCNTVFAPNSIVMELAQFGDLDKYLQDKFNKVKHYHYHEYNYILMDSIDKTLEFIILRVGQYWSLIAFWCSFLLNSTCDYSVIGMMWSEWSVIGVIARHVTVRLLSHVMLQFNLKLAPLSARLGIICI